MFVIRLLKLYSEVFQKLIVNVLHLNVNEYILMCLWKIVYSYVNQRWG